jgi:hypothetical protein
MVMYRGARLRVEPVRVAVKEGARLCRGGEYEGTTLAFAMACSDCIFACVSAPLPGYPLTYIVYALWRFSTPL